MKLNTELFCFFLLISLFSNVNSSICTNGFSEIYNNCYKILPESLTKADAKTRCEMDYGAAILTIHNAADDFISKYMQGVGVTRLWLGLYCDHSTPESCLWDYGQGNALLTNRFLSDSPDISKGRCVYMDAKTGNWSSVDCGEKMPYMCELPQTLEDPSCDHNYYGYCYFPHSAPLAYGDAQKVCTQNNADLISIHSEFENVFVSIIFKTPGAVLIGGVALSRDDIIWTDFSLSSGYNNIQSFNTGHCLFMNVYTDNDTDGFWFVDTNHYNSSVSHPSTTQNFSKQRTLPARYNCY
ncbi:hypothetical protein CRE_30207 [Caenorhabditis remanei]|uniref:C-type lectin domain-containing protein n=1 Tax=Caenorhabditis remanei TaxID=31234 RepID=E3NGL9_CAERE|nr:hypothetical protein CRE_30207 [Caenorhabditis remanei]